MKYDQARALQLLREGSGNPAATFRDSQEDAIRHLVTGAAGRLLVIQRTGWGKSFVYFIAAKLIREQGGGPTLLVSPLLALMRDQEMAAERMKVTARTVNSTNRMDWSEIAEQIDAGKIDVLMFHPKQLASAEFQASLLARIPNVSMLVVDEAHCISDWGHDFVPEYKLVTRLIAALPPNLPVLATTATANERVSNDLERILGPDLLVKRGSLNRPSITLQTITFTSDAQRLAWLAKIVQLLPGSGIIYALTKAHVHYIVSWLTHCGLSVKGYTSDSEDRAVLEQELKENKVKALVATSALGMGYDKPDLTFVINYQPPSSVVHYYQQVGRAGRAIADARGIVLAVKNQLDINTYFIESAFPRPDEVTEVMKALDAAGDEGLSVPDLQETINLSKGRIEKTLTALAIESPAPIVKDGSAWKATGSMLAKSFWETAGRVTELRRAEHAQMREYMALTEGHMKFLVSALDGEPTTVEAPRSPPLPTAVAPALVAEADRYMRDTSLPIKARKKWPDGGLDGYGLRGSIAEKLRAGDGFALSMYGTAGWGDIVRDARYEHAHFGDDLVKACAGLVRRTGFEPAPKWVTCIPSLNNSDLVPSFAKRLASELGLPFHAALTKVKHTSAQKSMRNSSQQARNLDQSLEFSDFDGKVGPVLLVDDIVNSGWTFTIGAWLLRSNGCGEVWPLALAKTGNEE
ncbi:DEAD/DEAH box helicase [Xanthomonas sp. Leaf148]|uniref:DEAD/DEAH box helicase n=1 Tax=Xanthomonas sp. Leaf148 TaxID=1736275 RepID=UPI0006F97062|nr:DEAD/DEAH box helicase [Xanthomonas sp. Leaf148]KQR07449.1 ATP-dependent DNA helicase RecG [Xanthomonas sp. Leaf148]